MGSNLWLIVFLVLVFIELATVNLVSIWFAIGALVSFIVSMYIDSITIELTVFVVVSTIALLLTKKFVNRVRKSAPEKTNLDRVIGKIGVVTMPITKLEPGEVKADGKKWCAVSNKKIGVGSKVEILSIDGVKLTVKEVKIED